MRRRCRQQTIIVVALALAAVVLLVRLALVLPEADPDAAADDVSPTVAQVSEVHPADQAWPAEPSSGRGGGLHEARDAEEATANTARTEAAASAVGLSAAVPNSGVFDREAAGTSAQTNAAAASAADVNGSALEREVHSFLRLDGAAVREMFEATRRGNRTLATLVATNFGDTARLTLCEDAGPAVWITVAGHLRTFARNAQHFRSFVEGDRDDSAMAKWRKSKSSASAAQAAVPAASPPACRVVVLFTREDAEASGKVWWGNRQADSVNPTVNVVSQLQKIEQKYFGGANFVWFVTRSYKGQRLADGEVMSYVLTKRLKVYHEAFRKRYVKWRRDQRGRAAELAAEVAVPRVILGRPLETKAARRRSAAASSFAEARAEVLALMLRDLRADAVPGNSSSGGGGAARATDGTTPRPPPESPSLPSLRALVRLVGAREPPPAHLDDASEAPARLEHVFLRTRPDLLFARRIRFGQIAAAYQQFRLEFARRQAIGVNVNLSAAARNGSSATSSQVTLSSMHAAREAEPVVVLGFVLLHRGVEIIGKDPSEVFFAGSEAYFDVVVNGMLKDGGWPGFVWPNLVWGASEVLLQRKVPSIGGVFLIPKAFHVYLHRLASGQLHRLNCGAGVAREGSRTTLGGAGIDLAAPIAKVMDFTRNAIRWQKIPGKMKIKFSGLPKTRENLTMPSVTISF
eukprot:TRINITY_DN13925_c0_g1_i2.p1 TRINITY_DN13925_c0_g1~~TRINITY_DN13925_c0_g1_i2.p1  ORF type:complete len:689 (-),score=166.64 TRINITY_DN13925_c0_g1_i2:93-2159(-)